MLVLSRHRDEWIDIGEVVSICVVEIRGDKVRKIRENQEPHIE